MTIKLTQEIIDKVKSIAKEFKDIAFLAIIGSTITRGISFHDIDFAIKVTGKRKYDTLYKLTLKLSKTLGIPEEQIDIVDIDRADIELKAKIIHESIVIVDKGYLNKLHSELSSKYQEHKEYLDISLREWLHNPNPSTIDIVIVKRRLDFIKEEIEFLEQHVLSKEESEVESSPILKRLLERSFQLITEAIIDTCRHIASAKGWLREYTAREAIKQCAEHKAISDKLAKTISNMITIRNIIIHRYLDIDYKELYKKAKNLKNITKEFEKSIVKYLRIEALKETKE